MSRAALINAFTPAREVTEPTLFAGRREQVRLLADALHAEGSVPIIFGDRGLGKSSLAVQAELLAIGDTVLLSSLNDLNSAIPEENSYLTLHITCSDEIRDTNQLLQALINAAEDIDSDPLGDGEKSMLVDRQTRRKLTVKVFETESTRTYRAEAGRIKYESLNLTEKFTRVIRLLLQVYDQRVLIVIDELDRVKDLNGFSSFVKATSGPELKYMLVGIAQSLSDLALDHPSIERAAVPVRMPRMSNGELADIVDGAVRKLREQGLPHSFDPAARKRLVRTAGGFPWFVHVIGQDALKRAADTGSHVVSEDIVIQATRNLVTNQFAQHFADAYQRAVRDSIQREKVLRTLASWADANVPTAQLYPVLKSLGVTNPSVYKRHLMSEEYGAVIMTPGYQKQGLVRFRNEMFKQYVTLAPSLYERVDDDVRKATDGG